MSTHYNAFISYKHEVKDSRIADMIQRELEHYKIPPKIQKATGLKKIERIFRDKNELPITSNLSDTISEALNHSDYLIVICSTKTKESIWVSREIEFFLRTHSKRQVLTVLVDGEPEDVIPPILLSDERTVYNSYGQPEIIRTALEPLSCDYRMPIRRARRQELPRLASTLIGCSYDDLINRQRQYTIRHMTLLFAAAMALSLSFGIYMYNSRKSIQKNYLAALKNQSRYLANESEKLLEDEKRITAIQLALESLPKNKEDLRPIIPEAVGALIKSSYAYVSKTSSTFDTECSYSMLNNISTFDVSDNGTYLAAYDYNSNLSIWNLETNELLYSRKNNNGLFGNNIKFLPNNNLLSINGNVLKCLDISNLSEIWEYDFNSSSIYFDKISISENGIYVLTDSDEVFYLSMTDGAVIDRYKLPTATLPADYNPPQNLSDLDILLSDTMDLIASMTDAVSDAKNNVYMYISDISVSPDNTKIIYSSSSGLNDYIIGCFDIKTKKVVYSDPNRGIIKNIQWLDNNQLVISVLEPSDNLNSSIGNFKILISNKTNIYCFDSSDMSEKWHNDIITNEPSINDGFLSFEDSHKLAFYTGDAFKMMNSNNGQDIYSGEVNEAIIFAYKNNKNTEPIFITRSGSLAFPNYSDKLDSISVIQSFSSNLDLAEVSNGKIYVHQMNSSEILSYSPNIYDDNWKEIKNEDSKLSTTPYNYYISGNALIYYKAENNSLIIINLSSEDYRSIQIPMDTSTYYSSHILGVYDNKIYISYFSENYTLLEIDIISGKTTDRTISKTNPECESLLGNNGTEFTYIGKNSKYTDTLFYYDIKEQKSKEYPLDFLKNSNTSDEAPESINSLVYLSDKDTVLYYSDKSIYMTNLTNQSTTTIATPDSWNGTSFIEALDEINLFAVSDNNQILLLNTNGDVTTRIHPNGGQPYGIKYYSDKHQNFLLVLCEDGSIQRFNLENGAFEGSTSISFYTNDISDSSGNNISFIQDESTSRLYIVFPNITNVIDTESWIGLFSVDNCLGYHKNSDRFITYSSFMSNDVRLGYFNQYTLDELKERARNLLHGSELSQEQKSKYGIDYDGE